MYHTLNDNLQRTNLATNRINNNTIANTNVEAKDVCSYNQNFVAETFNVQRDITTIGNNAIGAQQNYENQVDNNRDSFTFEDIGAIINSKEFADLTANPTARNQETYESDNTNQNDTATYNRESGFVQENNQPVKVEPQVYAQLEPGCKFVETTNLQDLETIYRDFYQPNTDYFRQPENAYYVMSTNNRNKTHLYNNLDDRSKPYVEIVEQPAKCSLRFRYKCEGRSAGSLAGQNATLDNKSFPSIRIANYVGRAVVVISCVTKDAPYRAHPHNIVGKEGCKKGICTIVINNEASTIRSFSSLGIQCVKRKDIEESLSLRESINVDPFRNGFSHKFNSSNIDLNVVRLCFQVFIEGSTSNKCDVPLTPVVSEPVHDKKAMSDLVITKLSHCSAPATGGREVILLCDRISKDDIQIRFYEERDGKLVWETYTELSPTDVHKQVAICFKTPKYYNENITQPVMVRIQLKRVSDNQVSEPRMFQFLPCESDEDIISRKRQKIEWVNSNHYALDSILQPHNHLLRQQPVSNVEQPSPMSHQMTNHNMRQPQHAQDIVLANCLTTDNQQHHQQPQRLGPSGSPTQTHQSIAQNRMHTVATSKPPAMTLGPPSASPESSRSPSTQLQQGEQFINNMVVRREIIDNEGKVMRLVDRPDEMQQHQVMSGNQVPMSKPLGSSLDRIDTAELMRDVTFNSTIDFNLGSSLSLHLNGGDGSTVDHQTQAARAKDINCNSKLNKD